MKPGPDFGSSRKKIRVKIRPRSQLPRSDRRLTAGKIILVLIGSVLVGILLGWGIGRTINKALRIRRQEVHISGFQSGGGPSSDSSPSNS